MWPKDFVWQLVRICQLNMRRTRAAVDEVKRRHVLPSYEANRTSWSVYKEELLINSWCFPMSSTNDKIKDAILSVSIVTERHCRQAHITLWLAVDQHCALTNGLIFPGRQSPFSTRGTKFNRCYWRRFLGRMNAELLLNGEPLEGFTKYSSLKEFQWCETERQTR